MDDDVERAAKKALKDAGQFVGNVETMRKARAAFQGAKQRLVGPELLRQPVADQPQQHFEKRAKRPARARR